LKEQVGDQLSLCYDQGMRKCPEVDTIYFTSKEHVTIPRWLRKNLRIKKGTRALVYRDGDAIVLKPITPGYIKNLRGSLKGFGVLKSLMDGRKREREL
jgi:bifunctional DNA-binding transcriptional regulator/antitoxin component of YhaV-PrlF toxin-antitoxin module